MSASAATRVLLTADAVGGVWQYATDLAGGLAALGLAPTIALLGPAPSADQRRAIAPGVTLVETGLPLDWLCDDPAPVLAAGHAIADLARSFDLVQLNMPTLGAEARFDVPVVAVAHGCLATWWAAARGEPLPEHYRWHQALMAQGLTRASAAVAPTRAYGAVVQQTYGLRQAPLAIHNGRQGRTPATLPLPANELFTAGRLWDEVKNMGLLNRVAARLPVPVHAAGALAGPHGERIALDHVVPVGILDRAALEARLARRPLFVSTARFEPFGLAVLEAAQAACPLLLADIPTFRELWDGAATFVDPDDASGFATAAERIFGDPAQADALGRAAAARAGRYTVEATASRMAGLYARLLPAAGMERAAAA